MFYNKRRKLLRCYVSEADQFLQELRSRPGSRSESALAEEQKYRQIFKLRDQAGHNKVP